MDIHEILLQGSIPKRKVGIDFQGNGTNSLEIRGQKPSIFVVSGHKLVCQCTDLSEIVLQGSISQREGWNFLRGNCLKRSGNRGQKQTFF